MTVSTFVDNVDKNAYRKERKQNTETNIAAIADLIRRKGIAYLLVDEE